MLLGYFICWVFFVIHPMKMWSMKVIILLLFCYACLSTENGGVRFVSRNFNNVLHWDPVMPAFPGQEILYSVQYWSDAKEQPYQIKEECENMTALFCDLTAETPSVHDVHYLAKVSVNGSIHGRTNTFKPLADTILGLPTLTKYTTVSSLHVNVTLPLGPNEVSIADIISSSKNVPSKAGIVYTLRITHPKWAAQVNKTTTGQFVINLKNNQTEYCGDVVYQPSSEWGRKESEKASFCVTLQSDPLMLLPWLLMSAALLAVIVMISVVCICKYVKGGKEKSMTLQLGTTPSTMARVLQSLDRNLIISKLEVCVQSDQTVYATIQVKPNVRSDGVGDYSPQDIPCQTWQGSTGSSVGTGAHSLAPNPQDTSAQSSEIYSVVVVHVPAEENEDFQRATIEDGRTSNQPLYSNRERWDNGGMSLNLTSHGVPPLCNLDVCESNSARPLLLETVRDTNGELMLPSLTLQLQSSTGDTVSPLNSERKPLLSDLIDSRKGGASLASLHSFDSQWSDSGCEDSSVNTPTQLYCNTDHSTSQPVVPDSKQGCQNISSSEVIFESGYKQNWMPAILGTAPKDSCEHRSTNYPWTWTGLKKEEEGEEGVDRREEESSRQIILGHWFVQIQE